MDLESVKQRLLDIVGPANLSDDKVVRESYQYMPFFGTTWRTNNFFVVLPESVEQVSAIIKLANEFQIPVSPRGGLGFGGLGRGILLDMTQMNRIVSIDEVNGKAIAEGGCSFFHLAHELFKKGYILPTSEFGPAVTVAATAQNPAVSFGKTRYGRNSQLVEGLEVVLPNGEVVRVGSLAYEHTPFGAYSRYITGPDLVGLFTQSGGAFGIITKVAYRCIRRPASWGFYSYYWPKDQAESLCQAMRDLAAREIFDIHLNDKGLTQAAEQRGDMPPLPDDCWFTLYLIANAETQEELSAKEHWIEDIVRQHGGKAMEHNLCQEHWDWPTFFHMIGHPLMTAIYQESGNGFLQIADSIYYPLSRFPEVYQLTESLCAKYGLIGDDSWTVLDAFVFNDQVICSQLWIFLDPYDQDRRKRIAKFHYEFSETLGSQGVTWQNMYPPVVPAWAWKNQASAYELIVQLKKLLDPKNVLMPGNIF